MALYPVGTVDLGVYGMPETQNLGAEEFWKQQNIPTQVNATVTAPQGVPQPDPYARPTWQNLSEVTDYGQMGGVTPINFQGISVDPYSMGTYASLLGQRATSKEPSEWLKLQLQNQQLEQNQATDTAAQTAASQAAQARAQLSMRGGLSGGSRERLASQAARQTALSRQGILTEGMKQRLGLQTSEEENKQKLLSQAAGLETDIGKMNKQLEYNTKSFNTAQDIQNQRYNQEMAKKIEQQNIANKTAERNAKMGFNMSAWQELMRQQAANRNADATLAASKAPTLFDELNPMNHFPFSGKL